MDILESINLYNLGKTTWNKWALSKLDERAKLEQSGKWHIESSDSNGAVLSGSVETMNWVSECSATFLHHYFTEQADFSEYIFPWKVTFSGAVFNKAAIFNGCEFRNELIMVATAFKQNACFRDVIFWNGVCVERATFESMLWIDRTKFHGYTHIYDTMFFDNVEWEASNFERGIFMEYCHFKKDANFHGICVVGQGLFRKCVFEGSSSWSSANFRDEGNWLGSKFHGYSDFGEAKFGQIPVLIQTDFLQAPSIASIQIISDKSEHFDAITCWRALRKVAELGLDGENEKGFFVKEIKELQKKRGVLSAYSILGYFYECLSDFGQSITRPLIWLVVSILLFSFVYLIPNISLDEFTKNPFSCKCYYGEGNKARSSLSISLNSALPLGILSSDDTQKAEQICLFGAKQSSIKEHESMLPDISLWLQLTSKIQTIFSSILLFLFGLAIRNKFRIN